MANPNDFKVLTESTKERHWSTIPLGAYTKRTWLSYFKYVYYTVTDKKYEVFKIQHEMSYLETAYRRVFVDRQWSAREFSRFLLHSVSRSHENSKITFTLKTFSKKSQYIDSILSSYDRRLTKKRDSSRLEGTIYLPFNSLTPGQNDLLALFEMLGDDITLIGFNYGIPNYVKYLQYMNKIDLDEAISIFKIRLRDLLIEVKEDKTFIRGILEGVVRNSILWEPYTSREQREKFGEDSLIINWRKELSSLIDFFGFNKEIWWREKYNTYKLKRIPVVKDFFK